MSDLVNTSLRRLWLILIPLIFLPLNVRGELPEITPPVLPSSPHVVPLPGEASDICVGGGGRYLIFYLNLQQQLVVFDVSEATVVKYLPASSGHILFAAGADKLVIVDPSTKEIQRWSLEDFQLEQTESIDIEGEIAFISMGSASDGPILVVSALERNGVGLFLDLRTLSEKSASSTCKSPRFTANPGSNPYAYASANGQVFRMPGSDRSSGDRLPSPDGRLVFNAREISTTQGNTINHQHDGSVRVPAQHGEYALGISSGELNIQAAPDYQKIAVIPNVSIPAIGEPPFRGSPFEGMGKKFFLIPDGDVLAYVPPERDRVILHQVKFGELLKSPLNDFLAVNSTPPPSVAPGGSYSYRLRASSSNEPIAYHLESGPTGMEMSSDGEITWNVPDDELGSFAQVITSISDASGSTRFHSFKVFIDGNSKTGLTTTPDVKVESAPMKQPLDLSQPINTNLSVDEIEMRLPDIVHRVAWGANGRLLFLYFQSIQSLGVFDVNACKLVHFIPATTEKFYFAAGATKLVTVDAERHIMTRYDLATFQREQTIALDTVSEVSSLTMDMNSEGPISLSCGRNSDQGSLEVNLETLIPIPPASRRSPGPPPREEYNPDGVKIPAITGHAYVMYKNDVRAPGIPPVVLNMFLEGDPRCLITTSDLPPIAKGSRNSADTTLPFAERIQLHPDAGLLIIVPLSLDRMHIYNYRLEEIMQASGADYLFVASSPPPEVELNEALEYEIDVKAKNGPVRLSLESAPNGMSLNGNQIAWSVPNDHPLGVQNAIVLVQDADGQELFHKLELEVVPERTAQQPTAPPQSTVTRPPTFIPRSPETNSAMHSSPSEIEQPEQFREWTDVTGRHKTTARLIGFSENGHMVALQSESGKQITMELQKLSADDIAYAVALYLKNNANQD